MYRVTVIVLSVCVLVTASAVFAIKKDAERAAERAGALSRQIDEEKARIAELRAAWSAADDPGRLQRLVDQHRDLLGLAPIEASQIGTFDDVPRRPVISPDTPADDPLAAPTGNDARARQEG